jgi:hypothetical protein
MGLFPVAAMGKQERRNSGCRPWEMTKKKFGRHCWAGQPRKMRKQRGASASMGKKGSRLGGKRVGRCREGPAATHPSKASNSRGAMGGEEPSSLLQPLLPGGGRRAPLASARNSGRHGGTQAGRRGLGAKYFRNKMFPRNLSVHRTERKRFRRTDD